MSGTSDNLLYLSNPELAIALRRRKLGEQLMQQGSDGSPIQSPWQGVNRLAQALIGGYELNKADTAVDDYAKKGQEKIAGFDAEYADIMRGGAPQSQPQAGAMPAAAPRGNPGALGPAASLPEQYRPLIEAEAARRGMPAHLFAGLYGTESSFRPDAVNPQSGAGGIGQILASTAANPGYGLQPLPDADRFVPEKAIPWSMDYLKARGAAVGATDWNNPQHVERGLRAYGENTPEYARRVMGKAGYPVLSGSVDPVTGQPGPTAMAFNAPAAAQGAQPQMPGAGASPGQPATGANAPQVKQAQALMALALRTENAAPYDPVAKQKAAAYRAQAKFIMAQDIYQNTPDGGQVNARTGERKYPPTPRMATDAQGNLIAVNPGGGTSVVSPGGANPGVNSDANATRVLQSYPPTSPEYRDAYAHLYGERTEMGPSGPITYRPRQPPQGLAPPAMGGTQPQAGAGGGPGVTYATPVQPNAPLARQIGVPLADSNPYEGMAAAEQQKLRAENVRAVRERFAKRDESDAKADETITALQRFKELNAKESTGPSYGLPVVGGALRGVSRFTPAFQEMEAIAANIAPNMRAPGSGASSDADVALFKNATVSIDKPQAVNRNIADAHIIAAQNKKDLQAFTQAFVEANGHEQGAERMWNKYLQANPIFDPEKKDTFGLNTARVPWQQWFQNAIDPQTGRMKVDAPGVMRFDKNGNLVNGR